MLLLLIRRHATGWIVSIGRSGRARRTPIACFRAFITSIKDCLRRVLAYFLIVAGGTNLLQVTADPFAVSFITRWLIHSNRRSSWRQADAAELLLARIPTNLIIRLRALGRRNRANRDRCECKREKWEMKLHDGLRVEALGVRPRYEKWAWSQERPLYRWMQNSNSSRANRCTTFQESVCRYGASKHVARINLYIEALTAK